MRGWGGGGEGLQNGKRKERSTSGCATHRHALVEISISAISLVVAFVDSSYPVLSAGPSPVHISSLLYTSYSIQHTKYQLVLFHPNGCRYILHTYTYIMAHHKIPFCDAMAMIRWCPRLLVFSGTHQNRFIQWEHVYRCYRVRRIEIEIYIMYKYIALWCHNCVYSPAFSAFSASTILLCKRRCK